MSRHFFSVNELKLGLETQKDTNDDPDAQKPSAKMRGVIPEHLDQYEIDGKGLFNGNFNPRAGRRRSLARVLRKDSSLDNTISVCVCIVFIRPRRKL